MKLANPDQRLAAPWSVEDKAACFVVRTARGQAVAWVYWEERDQFQTMEPKLNRDQARRVAANIAKLPDLLKTAARP